MIHIFREVRVLRQEGKLHQRLLRRVRMLLVVSLALFAFVLYSIITAGSSIAFIAALMIGGFLLGMFVFSRMSPIQWNEEQEIVESGRMGTLGWTTLGLYVLFEIGSHTVLDKFFPVSPTGYIIALVFGVIFGRSLGMIIEIHRVYRSTHTS